MKICRDCVLENYETVERFDNYMKTSRKLRDFEIGPSDDFVCQYIYHIVEKLNVQNVS